MPRQPTRVLVLLCLLCLISGCALRADANPATATGAPARPGGQVVITAMTYNILGGPVPDDWFPLIPRAELIPTARAPGVVAKVRLADPDIIGFQEFAHRTPAGTYLEEQLRDYVWLHSAGEHALAFRANSFDLLGHGTEKLVSAGEQGSFLDRYADWARLRDRATGRVVLVVNVHQHPVQTPVFARVRSVGIGRLVAAIERLDPGLADPLVLLGDFNAGNAETRPVFADHLTGLAAAGFVDAGTVARADTSDVPRANSLHQLSAAVAGEPVAKVVRRNGRYIDYVWVPRGTTVLSWAVVSGPGVEWRQVHGKRVPVWTGVVPSDHSPVVARLRYS